MLKFLREYAFFIVLGIFVLCFIGFVTIIAVAPHNDIKMRGFTPCTYQIAEKLMVDETLRQSEVLGIIAKGYGCYFKVMKDGILFFYKGQQPTPWANYLFEQEKNTIEEDFDEDLEENNLLLEDEKVGDLLDISTKENVNE